MELIKILIVDDEPDIIEFLQYTLNKEKYITKSANNGLEAIEIYKTFQPNLILMDVQMPKLNGVETCERIRNIEKNGEKSYIVFLSARSEEYTQIATYDAGGDDFINKPIKPRILVKKIKAILNREKNIQITEKNGISIDVDKHLIFLNKKKINLTKRQFQILNLLYINQDRLFSREQILKRVWEKDYYVTLRNVDVQIRKIREVIGKKKIITIKGMGYKFSSE